MEDNIHTTTETFMITSNSAERSCLSPRKVKAETESDPVISHKKKGAPAVHPLEHLIGEATAPNLRLTRFQVAYTDPNGPL